MIIQLGTSLSYIENIKEGVKKRYNDLKVILKKHSEILSVEKNRSVSYAKEISANATKHYFKLKHQVEEISKTDRVAKQIVRTWVLSKTTGIKSIKYIIMNQNKDLLKIKDQAPVFEVESTKGKISLTD